MADETGEGRTPLAGQHEARQVTSGTSSETLIRVTFGFSPTVSLGYIRARLGGLEHIIKEPLRRGQPRALAPTPPGGWPEVNIRVVSLNYNSPLEILLAISAGATSLGATLATLIHLFNKYNEARVGKARADLEITALKVVREILPATGSNQIVTDKWVAATLSQMTGFEVEDGPGSAT